MPLRCLRLLVLLAALVPGAWYAWHWRSSALAREYHDDGLYYVGAKSLAETGRYGIGSLPSQPPQTKYPPLFPAVLSIAWHIEPQYPANLPVAMFLCWMWLPLTLILLIRWLRSAGLSQADVLLITIAWALNPYVIYFSTVMLSEMQFTFFLLAAILCLQSPHSRAWAMAAGLLGGLAFLTRTAGVALLPAALLYYGVHRRWRQFGLFAAAMLPAVLYWTAWSAQNRTPGTDAVTLYYTNYFGYFLSSFQWGEAYLYVWKNLDGMVHGLGALLLPDTTFSALDKVLAESLAIGGLIGTARLVRANRNAAYLPYAAFAVCYVLMLAFWNFPPNERFMLPVAPLWLAGFYTEMQRVARNIATVYRKPDVSQKIAGGVITALLASLLLYCGVRQWTLLSVDLPAFDRVNAEHMGQSEMAMDWILKTLPVDARFVAANDPLLYLRTGRRGAGLFPPTIYWYRDDQSARVAAYTDAAVFGREHKFGYLLLNDWDWSRDLPPEDHARLMRSLKSDSRLEPLYSHGPTTIFRIR